MNDKQCKQVLDEIFMGIFEQKCLMNMEQILSEFAFDIRLPNKVIDAVDGKETWAPPFRRGLPMACQRRVWRQVTCAPTKNT